jgi:uncharacterized membrane protein
LWLELLAGVLLVVGLFFRFYNLDRKVYWNDEVLTSLRLSGHSAAEMTEAVFDGRERTIDDLQRYQHLNPDRSWRRTLTALAADDPKQAPLYYGLLRLWAGGCGDSIRAVRGLSALLSLLAFPGLYWLCRELYETPRTAWIAVALMAVSPFHVLYAQEARPYSLWTATTLLASAALLWALRRRTWWSWSLYAATVALGFYSHTLFGLVAIAHGAYVAGVSLTKSDWTARLPTAVIAYLVATLAALIVFAPWGLLIAAELSHLLENTAWITTPVGVSRLFGRWALSFSAVFLDLSCDFSHPLKHLHRLPALILVCYALYFLYRRSPKRVWLMPFTLIGIPGLTLMLPDVVLGGRYLSSQRFLLPCYLGIQLAVAYLLATQTVAAQSAPRKTWQAVLVVLIVSGIVSCAISSQADTWWNKTPLSMYHPQAARIINAAPRPLLVSDASGSNPRNVVALCYLLDPKVRLWLVSDKTELQVPAHFSDVFLFRPSAPLREKLEREKGYRIEAVDPLSGLWRLVK